MNDRQQDVLKQLTQFRIDDDSKGRPDLTFTQRLARENRWSVAYAERVVDEYKRFVFLASFAGHPVTPSDQVDQAWHLHMTYTRSYWDRLCGQVLGKPLHHNPTRGGAGEDAKFNDWYARTKGTYFLTFGAEPPADIWPSSDERFDPRQRWVRVNSANIWMLPRPRLAKALAATLLLATSIVVAGCVPNRMNPGVFVFVLFGLLAFAVIASIVRGYRGAHRKSDASGCGSGGCGSGWWFFGGGDSSSSHDSDSDSSSGSDSGSSGCSSSGCGGGGCGGGGCGGGD